MFRKKHAWRHEQVRPVPWDSATAITFQVEYILATLKV